MTSGRIAGSLGENWSAVDQCLHLGLRGLPKGLSLARLLAHKRGVRNIRDLPSLTESQILVWADEFHERIGTWPTMTSGRIASSLGENWRAVDSSLRVGLRGLPGGSSLPRLLARERGVRNRRALPLLSESQILAWADAFHERTGRWPKMTSGRIAGSLGEKWENVDQCLRVGTRSLPGRSSLARLLAKERGVRNHGDLPPLTTKLILCWADAHHQRTGHWPSQYSGSIQDAPGETWLAVEAALRQGARSLPGGSTLLHLLHDERRVRDRGNLPLLRLRQILAWADAHRRRTGKWPTQYSGPIPEAPGETWAIIQMALLNGKRALPGGSSLARLLHSERGVRNKGNLPSLRPRQILAWADAHRRRTGNWPKKNSGPIQDAPAETWMAIDMALHKGHRSLPGDSSLPRLLHGERGVRNKRNLPAFRPRQILAWADAHRRRTGQWPKEKSGPILDAPGETWAAVDAALRKGRRGLRRGGSLSRLLKKHREKYN